MGHISLNADGSLRSCPQRDVCRTRSLRRLTNVVPYDLSPEESFVTRAITRGGASGWSLSIAHDVKHRSQRRYVGFVRGTSKARPGLPQSGHSGFGIKTAKARLAI